MSAISLVQTTDRNVNQLQQNIKQALDPVLSNPLLAGTLFTKVSLVSGTNSIPTGLNRNIQGWLIFRNRASANFYDTQDTNPTPTKTLQLVSSAITSVDIYIF